VHVWGGGGEVEGGGEEEPENLWNRDEPDSTDVDKSTNCVM
jgi:hypothetical protein